MNVRVAVTLRAEAPIPIGSSRAGPLALFFVPFRNDQARL